MIGNINMQQVNEQFEKAFATPVRSYATLALDHAEKLAALQYSSAKAYMDLGLEQARSALDIKDQNDVQAFVSKQQKFAQTLADRVKGDMEKVVELQKDFADKSRKVVEDGVSSATKSAKTTKSSGSSSTTTQKTAAASK